MTAWGSISTLFGSVIAVSILTLVGSPSQAGTINFDGYSSANDNDLVHNFDLNSIPSGTLYYTQTTSGGSRKRFTVHRK